ncbi:MAG: ATP-binding cassette domain-containing protein [Lautropia sp.]|nr:ATP-binding cassette domain-containing protein [Lautropia sp.]
MTIAGTALFVEGLIKRFGSREVLHGISFNVRPGEFVALLGPNGAGKTTLFQILTGLYATDAGTVAIAGHVMDRANAWPDALGELGVVFQQPALDLDLSVEANLAFHAALHGLERRSSRARLHALLERFGIADRANEQCRKLSGGTRRKVELARALLSCPKVLLMDEATVGLDPASRVQLLADVKAGCAEEGRAVLWATHLTEEAERTDRVIVLHQGTVHYDGMVSGLLAQQVATSVEEAFLAMTAAAPVPAGSR